MKEVREIVRAWLEANGYDGLYADHTECACENTDLMPCEEPSPGCTAGVKGPCPPDCEYGGECDWHILPREGDAS